MFIAFYNRLIAFSSKYPQNRISFSRAICSIVEGQVETNV